MGAVLHRIPRRTTLCPMKLRTDLLKHLTKEDFMEEVLVNNPRYKAEPNFSKTGVGSLSSASTEERASEVERNTALIQKLRQRAQQAGQSGTDKK